MLSLWLIYLPVTSPYVMVPQDIENYFRGLFMENRWGYTGLDHPFQWSVWENTLKLCIRFHINVCRLFEKQWTSLIVAHCAVCSRIQGVLNIYCSRSWHSYSTGRNVQIFFFICAVFHCTVSVLMTLNTMYVIFKSVIPFYVYIAFKFLTFYFNFLLILALCLCLKYKVPMVVRIHNVVPHHVLTLCTYNS